MPFRSIIVYFFYLLLIFVPFSMEIGDTVKVECPLEIAMALYNLGLLAYSIKNYRDITWRNLSLWAVIGLQIAAGFSIFNAIYPMIALKAWIVSANYCFAFFGSWFILNFSKEEKDKILWVACLSYGALLLYAAGQYAHIGIQYQNSYLMAKPFAVGHTLLFAMGFPLWLYLSNEVFSKKTPWWKLGLWIVYTIYSMLSYSRLYWILIPLCIGLLILNYWKKARWYFVTLSIVGLFAGFFTYKNIKDRRDREKVWLDANDHNTLFVQIQSIFEMRANESNLERFNRWNIGKVMFEEHPWSGVGLNNYATVYPDISQRFDYEKTTRSDLKMNAHQWYLGCLYEQGIIGIVALLFFFAAFFWQNKKITFLAFLIFLHYFALGLIEDFLLLPEIVPAFWCCVGIFSTEDDSRPKNNAK
jgi:O-antigen ligase